MTRAATPLTQAMIDDLPVVDLHVHVPGTVSPQTAWALGVRNGFIALEANERGHHRWQQGDASLPADDPHEYYTDIFHDAASIALDQHGKPGPLRYNILPQNFKSFDRIMGTVQGHRHPPGGMQNESDYLLVLRDYLTSCRKQKVFYTELQQNIRIAYSLYPDMEPAQARKTFYRLAKRIQSEFAEHGVHLAFLHCFNKTGMAGDGQTPKERCLEGAAFLEEARRIAPGVFIGMESAGHKKDETGWPAKLKDGYDAARTAGFGCEAHGGEAIGVEHMLDTVTTLPISRLAHGFQAIEEPAAIQAVKDRGITLVMSPAINIALGSPVHRKDGKPLPKTQGGEPHTLTDLSDHPFFPLLREHRLAIALSTDNPAMGGVEFKTMLRQMAGLDPRHPFPAAMRPLSAEELAECCENAIQAAFCEAPVKHVYRKKLSEWAERHGVEMPPLRLARNVDRAMVR